MSSESGLRNWRAPRSHPLDRFFPNCRLGLAEWVAKRTYGIADLKKCWLGNTIVYERRFEGGWLEANQVNLAAHVSVEPETDARARRKLEEHYGILIRDRAIDSLPEVQQFITDSLARERPAIVSYDMSILQGPDRSRGAFHPHMIGIYGYDAATRRLRAVEQVEGYLSIAPEDLAASFASYRAAGWSYSVVDYTRDVPLNESLDREQVLQELRACALNLFSDSETRGISALEQLAQDVRQASLETRRAFVVPGLWIFSHDRQCLRQALPHWAEAGIGSANARRRIDLLLASCFDIWFEADMIIERSVASSDARGMDNVVRLLDAVIPVELELAEELRDVANDVRGAMDASEVHASLGRGNG